MLFIELDLSEVRAVHSPISDSALKLAFSVRLTCLTTKGYTSIVSKLPSFGYDSSPALQTANTDKMFPTNPFITFIFIK